MTFTPQQITFIMMVVDTAIKWAFRELGEMTEEELDKRITDEEERTKALIAELDKE